MNDFGIVGRRLWSRGGSSALFKHLSSIGEAGAILTIHFVLALVATYPLVEFYNSAVVGGGDSVQNLWNFWWVDRAVYHGDFFPYDTAMLYHPSGVSLAYHTLGLLNGWVGALLQSGMGLSLAATSNTITLLTFLGSGFTSYLLVRSLTQSPMAALVASLVFTFAPVRMSRVYYGNLNLYSTQFIPIATLFILKLIQTNRRRNAVIAALAIGATAGLDLFLAFGTSLFASLLLVLEILKATGQKKVAQLRTTAVHGVIVGLSILIAVLPFALPMVLNHVDFSDQSDQTLASVQNSADLLGFFVPDSPTNPVVKRLSPTVGRVVDQVFFSFSGNLAEKTVFIGYSVLLLVLISLFVSRRRRDWRWLMIAFVFFVLSLGPVLQVGGRVIVDGLPYAWMNVLPLIGAGRSPSRFAIFAMLALAVMVGQGLAILQSRDRRFQWLTLLAGLLIFAEFLIIPIRMDMRLAEIPAFYTQFVSDRDKTEGAILDVPIDLTGAQGPAAEYMLYQTVHEQPIVSGYISRTPRRVLQIYESPFLAELKARIYGNTTPFEFDQADLTMAAEDLRTLKVAYVVLHKYAVSAEDGKILHQALSTVLSDFVYEDAEVAVWRVD